MSKIDQVFSAAVINLLLSWWRPWLTLTGSTTSSPHLLTPDFHVVCQLLTQVIRLYVFTFNPVHKISLLAAIWKIRGKQVIKEKKGIQTFYFFSRTQSFFV